LSARSARLLKAINGSLEAQVKETSSEVRNLRQSFEGLNGRVNSLDSRLAEQARLAQERETSFKAEIKRLEAMIENKSEVGFVREALGRAHPSAMPCRR